MKILKNEGKIFNSEKLEILPNTQYQATTKIIAKQGLPYSSYFSVIICDSNLKEIKRYILWITEFNEKEETYTIIFNSCPNSKFAYIGYRINNETPVTSYIEIGFIDPKSLKLDEIKNFIKEKFDKINDFSVPKLEPLSEADENILESKITWIFGSPRTGTTWLGTQLLKHPETITWHEPYIGWHLDQLKNMYHNRHDYFFSKHHKNNWLPQLRKLILARTYSMAQTLEKNIIIKEPNGSGAADLLMECFPNSRLIFLLRDGRDVVDSQLDTHRKDSWAKKSLALKRPEIENEKMRLQLIKKYANYWERMTKIVWESFQKHQPQLRLLVKYEELRENTFEHLKKIYNFLNIEVDDETLNSLIKRHDFDNIPSNQKGPGKFYRSASPGGWKKSFNENEKREMNSIMEDFLNLFGYNV